MKTALIALFAVCACYFFPTTAGEYTELVNIRENTVLSAAIFVAMWIFCRNKVGYSIMAIEFILIFINHYISWIWQHTDASIIAIHYMQIQDAAYIIELGIIIGSIITGMRKIGADKHDFNNWLAAHSSYGNFRERYKC